MRQGSLQRIGIFARRWPWALPALALVLLGLATSILVREYSTRDLRTLEPSALEPSGFVITPDGSDVPRLTPIRVTFPEQPSSREGAQLLRLDPPAPGTYTWVGQRTLQYQPEFPGLLRGQAYTITVTEQAAGNLPTEVTKRFTTEDPLRVETVIPASEDSEVPRTAQILVQFNRSAAALTVLGEEATTPVIEADPPIIGKGAWLNTSLYRLVPADLLPNTEYRLRIRAQVTSLPDGVLPEDFHWRFTTLSPTLASVSPGANTQFAGPRQPVVLTFNQTMDRGSVEELFRLSNADGRAIPGTFSWSEEDTVATFTPTSPLDLESRFEILVPRGLKGAGRGETQQEWRSSFTTVGWPRVMTTIPADRSKAAGRYSAQILFTNPMNRESLEDRVSMTGIDVRNVHLSWQGDRNLYINVVFNPSTTYTASIAEGAEDRYGHPLGPYSFSFTTGALRSSVSFAVPDRVATFSSRREPVLYYHATNLDTVSFALHPLTPAEARTLQQRGFPPPPERFTPSQPPIRSWREQVEGRRDIVVLASTSLSGGGPLPLGDYYVTSGGDFGSEFAFSVVNSVLIAKLAHEELLIWALDHDGGEPLMGLKVQAGGPGLEGGEAITDAEGLASVAVPSPLQLQRNEPYVITLEDGGYRGVASTRWQQGIQPWQIAIPTEFAPREFVGHVYTDRPLYRPGEPVGYKGVVRLDDDAAYHLPLPSPPLDVVIVDSQSKVLRREPISLNEFGTFAGTFQLPADASTGDYVISVQYQPPVTPTYRGSVAGISFLVAEFRKPEFQVAMQTEKGSYVQGEEVAATLRATFFFGGPVNDALTQWSVLTSPSAPRFRGLERYSFADFDYYRTAVVTRGTHAQGRTTTDRQGIATFTTTATIAGNEGTQSYQLTATVTDQSTQQVSASTAVTVHPAALYAGIRTAQYVATTGKETSVHIVTVDTSGEPLPAVPVKIEIYQREWITTKEQTAEGARRYRSEPRDTLVETLTPTTDTRGQGTVGFTPRTSGTLRLVAEVTDAKGRTARSASFLWVSGAGEASWQVTNDDLLRLVADKDSYEVGDIAEVLVPTPFAGATGLVTVERGKIISKSLQPFTSNSERLRIPIIDHYVPNVFVSVILYRPPTVADPVPRYKVGYVKLSVSTATRVLNVSIQADRPQSRPGEKVRYDIKVTDSTGRGVRSELSVAVVDKALLSLTEERGPNGLRAFWFERGLAVSTSSSLAVSVDRANDVIVEPPAEEKGGSGSGLASERIRQEFRNTAYWQAQLLTQEDGTASVEVIMPDNPTTWRMQVRAVAANPKVGEGTHELLSTQPLLLRPVLPRFVRAGDALRLGLLVRNETSATSDVQVSLAAEGLEVSGTNNRRASVPPGNSVLLEWPAKATAEGRAKLTFSATGSRNLTDAVAQEFPVYVDVTPEATATGGVVRGEERSETIYLPSYALQQGGKLSIAVQSTLVGFLRGELAPLARLEYEGAERIASRLIATVGAEGLEAGMALQPITTGSVALDADLASLVARQRADGGWGWCQVCDSDPNITGWVLIALSEGLRAGRTVDAEVLPRAKSYVDGYLSRRADVARPADVNQKAFLLYSLARARFPNRGAAFALQEQYRAQLTNWGRAYLLLAMAEAGVPRGESHLEQTVNDLTAGAVPSANGNQWQDDPVPGSMHTTIRTTAVALRALVHVAPDHPLIEETARRLVVAFGAQECKTPVERAQAISSLSAFVEKTGELESTFRYEALLNDRTVLRGHFELEAGARQDKQDVPLTSIPLGRYSVLAFLRDFAQPGRLYYTLNLRYLTPSIQIDALNRGIAVSREYSALEDPDRRTARVGLGETVRVKVTVVAPNDLNYVVVEDLLPAGLEPLDPKLKTIDPRVKAQLEEERRRAVEAKQGAGYFAPWYRWYYNPWQHVDVRDDRVVLSAQRLPKGVYEYIYYARATTPGDYLVPPAHAQESYFPETFGRSDSSRFSVSP